MTKRINEIPHNEGLIHIWMGYCDRVFHWVIAVMLLSLFAGLFLSGTALGLGLIVLAIALFCVVLVPFILIKLFTPGKQEPQRDDGQTGRE